MIWLIQNIIINLDYDFGKDEHNHDMMYNMDKASKN